MTDFEFRFRPPDRRDIWRNLALTMSQAAALTGVSERQIQHWMDQGYITTSDHGLRKINGDNLDKIVLIRQARNAGIPLRRAVSMAQRYLREQVATNLDSEVAPAALLDLEERLRDLRSDIGVVERLIQNVAVGDGRVENTVIPRKVADRV